jgi:branched-chain amino acid transport system permease protein
MAEEADTTEAAGDRDQVYRAFHDSMQRRFLRTLVSDAVIAEHRLKPLGQHSEPLERLLHHFRVMPLAGRFAVKRDGASGTYSIVVLSGERGVPPLSVGDTHFATVEEAYHGIFMKRIEELMRT